jgi:hypothetical protein
VSQRLVTKANRLILQMQPHIIAVAAQGRAFHAPPGLAAHLAMVEPAFRGPGHRGAIAVGQIGVVGDQRTDLDQVDIRILAAREQLAAGKYGALVALATDEAGEVLAVQQIYLTDDGQKAPVKAVKRTNKTVDGWSERAVVRLPGMAPPILCEGIENGLSIWQATGRETWA